jgi:hypothetical protein
MAPAPLEPPARARQTSRTRDFAGEERRTQGRVTVVSLILASRAYSVVLEAAGRVLRRARRPPL